MPIERVNIWELKWGRTTEFETVFVARDFDAAVAFALEWIQLDKPDWKGIGTSDIRSLRRLNNAVFARVNERP